MILSPDLRSQFSLFLFLENIDQGAALRGHLAVSGYEVFMFRDQDLVIDRVRQAAPHILIFEIEALQTTLSEFVEQVLSSNSEILFLPLAFAEQAAALNEYREYNFVGMTSKGPDQDLRLFWHVEQICSELFFQYQNEQMLDSHREVEKKLEKAEAEIEDLNHRCQEMEKHEPFDLNREIAAYASAVSREEMVDQFLHHLQQKYLKRNLRLRALVLKFLPTVQSYIATQALELDIEKMRGIGARLEKEESEKLIELVRAGKMPKKLIQLVREGLKVEKFHVQPLILNDTVEAFFVLWVDAGQIHPAEFASEFSLFTLVYYNLQLLLRLKEIDNRDLVTDLAGRDAYFEKLNDEIARARRLQKAVSVAKISVDHLPEIEQTLGRGLRDGVLRSVAMLVTKTSRVNDMCFRTDENEITVLLPHSGRKGAAIRAERIRRLIENHSFNMNGQHVTISIGVSEYPTLCGTAEELELTSLQALQFISEKGGNKVCLYRARQDFKPDFDVAPM